MSLWIEIHCDLPVDGNNEFGEPLCFSYSSASIGGICGNDRTAMMKDLRLIERDAKGQGWIKTRKGWVCPACKTES